MKVIVTSDVYGYYEGDEYYQDGIEFDFDNLESALPFIKMAVMQKNKCVVIDNKNEVE